MITINPFAKLKSVANKEAEENITGANFGLTKKKDGDDSETRVSAITTMQISISPDNMICAVLAAVPKDDIPEPTEQDFYDFLKSHGIVHGVKKEKIEAILKFKSFGVFRDVAEGERPTDGKDATIEFFFDTNPDFVPMELPDGRVDYKELGLLQNVHKGTLLAKITKETQGTPGRDVFGTFVSGRAGNPIEAPAGTNVDFDKNALTATAAASGHVSYSNGRINIIDTYEHKGEVGLSSGNIYFVGNLIIKGDVRNGYSVKCDKDLTVNGVVEGSTIEVAGNCTIKGGVNGRNVGTVTCGGDLHTKFIENIAVNVGGSVYTSSIMNSTVDAARDIDCTTKPGMIIGGAINAGGTVSVNTIGNPNTVTQTDISIGVPPQLLKARKDFKASIDTMKNELTSLTKAVAYFESLEKRGALSIDKKAAKEQAVMTLSKKKLRVLKAEQELAEIEGEMLGLDQGQLNVYTTINRPTNVTINSINRFINRPMNRVRFFNSQNTVKDDDMLPPIRKPN